jgi:hypothetical protein
MVYYNILNNLKERDIDKHVCCMIRDAILLSL